MEVSEPPVRMMSASPYWIARRAMPMALPADAQAEPVTKLVPCNPCLIEIWPDIALTISLGMKCGEIRPGPRLINVVCIDSSS